MVKNKKVLGNGINVNIFNELGGNKNGDNGEWGIFRIHERNSQS